jgi:hypothetical protein
MRVSEPTDGSTPTVNQIFFDLFTEDEVERLKKNLFDLAKANEEKVRGLKTNRDLKNC